MRRVENVGHTIDAALETRSSQKVSGMYDHILETGHAGRSRYHSEYTEHGDQSADGVAVWP